jgi:hypothetical protein
LSEVGGLCWLDKEFCLGLLIQSFLTVDDFVRQLLENMGGRVSFCFARVASHVNVSKLGAAVSRFVECKYDKVVNNIQDSRMGIYVIAEDTSINTK